ncbi:MAG: integrase, partial [Bacteroidaceae bacterium]
MKEKLITEITQGMLQCLDNGQLGELRRVLIHCLEDYKVSETSDKKEQESQNADLIASFLAAKRIEGCSEKTITYYQNTIEAA